jgi:hypothetical protein
MNTANRKTRRAVASKSSKGKVKSAAVKATAAVKASKTTTPALPQPAQMTVKERIAALGDNVRPFYTVLNETIHAVTVKTAKYEEEMEVKSLDFILQFFAMREHVELKDMACGRTKGTPATANELQVSFLTKYFEDYANAVKGKDASIPAMDHDRTMLAEKVKRDHAAVENRIRSMFFKVVLATYYMDHVGATAVTTKTKGKRTSIVFDYTFTNTESKEETVNGAFSINKLVANGKTLVAQVKEKEGKAPTAQSAPRRAASTDTSKNTKEGGTVIAALESNAQAIANLSGKARENVLGSEVFGVELCQLIQAKFVERKPTLANVKPVLDLNAVVAWIKAQSFFNTFEVIDVAAKAIETPATELIKKEDMPKPQATAAKK